MRGVGGVMSNVWIEGFRNADTRKETPSLSIMSPSQPHQTSAPIVLRSVRTLRCIDGTSSQPSGGRILVWDQRRSQKDLCPGQIKPSVHTIHSFAHDSIRLMWWRFFFPHLCIMTNTQPLCTRRLEKHALALLRDAALSDS